MFNIKTPPGSWLLSSCDIIRNLKGRNLCLLEMQELVGFELKYYVFIFNAFLFFFSLLYKALLPPPVNEANYPYLVLCDAAHILHLQRLHFSIHAVIFTTRPCCIPNSLNFCGWDCKGSTERGKRGISPACAPGFNRDAASVRTLCDDITEK